MKHVKGDLDEILKEKYVVIDFWAPWCGPCLAFSPVFEETAKKYQQITFAKCNIDENEGITKSLGIMSIPTIIFFKNGKEVDRIIGTMPQDVFEGRVKSLLE